jgi:hypothetical protein
LHHRVVHIHFGPSKLALGLILPIALELGLSTHLIGRAGVSARPAFGVSLAPGGLVSFYPLASFNGPRTVSQMDPRIAGALEGGQMLITSTLRDGIVDRHPLVRELLEARGSTGETVFIACENSPHQLYGDLKEEFGANVQFLGTVVDRICPKYLPPSHGRRVVLAHRLGEWLIESPSEEGAITSLLAKSDLVSFHPDLRPYEERKRWLVNGSQLYLSLLAHQAGTKSLIRAANTSLRDPMNYFQAEVNRVLGKRHPALQGNLQYAWDHGKAFCEVTDDVPRMVAMVRADLRPFFRTFDRRIGEPARLAAELENGEVPEVFELARIVLDTLLGEGRAYDFGDPDDPETDATLDEAIDAEAIEAYGVALEGWVPENEIEAGKRRLGVILRSHGSMQEEHGSRVRLL